jgi:hypothetical protein
MKITLDIPDAVIHRAKSVAAQRGIALRVFVTEAVEEKLASASQSGDRPWVRLAGGLKHLHKETLRINGIMKREFGRIEPENWDRSSI